MAQTMRSDPCVARCGRAKDGKRECCGLLVRLVLLSLMRRPWKNSQCRGWSARPRATWVTRKAAS